ncbi:MAG: hypothetical protein EGS63_03710 [Lachnospira sp.]|nr:hypothetical protein [Lachnospira sp.]
MTDIFTLINQLSDDDIRLQLAFFDCVTLMSAAKETGSRLLSGMAEAASSLAQIFTDKLKMGYDYKKVSDMVEGRLTELKPVKREQLLKLMDIKLMELVSLSQQIDINTQEGREKLSILVIDTAGSGYSISQYMAPAHKMRIITDKYNEAFMDNLMQSLKNMTPDQLKEWSPIMDKAIGMADIETKRVVHKELMPDAFNGMGVLKCLRKQKSPTKLKLVIDCFGIEAFDYKSVEIKTMYQALRYFNRISVFQLARLISVAVKKYDRPLYAADELMPSYVADSDRVKADNDEKEYQALAKQISGLDEKKARCIKELETKKKQLEEADKRADAASENYTKVSLEFSELELKKDEYINGGHTEAETKSYYARVNDVKRQLDRGLEDSELKKRKKDELSNQVIIAQDRLELQEKEGQELRAEYKTQTDIRKNNLKRLWNAYYYKFHFGDGLFLHVAMNYTRSQIVTIEAMLKEVHDSRDWKVYLKEDRLYVYTGDKKPLIIKCSEDILEDVGYI